MTKQTMDMNVMVARNREIVFSRIEDETVMMSIETGHYYGVSQVGQHIWEMLESPCRMSDICRALVEKFDVTPDQCEREVFAFVEEMHDNGLVAVSQQE